MLAKQNEVNSGLVAVSSNTQNASESTALISDAIREKYCDAMRSFSDSDFSSTKWLVRTPEYNTLRTVSFSAFSSVPESIVVLVKCWAIQLFSISYSLGTIRFKLSQIAVFLKYFGDLNIPLSSIRNSSVHLFLSKYSEKPTLYNSLSCTISDFCVFASQNEICFAENIHPPTLHVKQQKTVRRAPDKCVVDALDKFFFTNATVPVDMRCAYLLLRLILNRISEILRMPIDCVSYPEEGIFAVSIATQKETPLHRPVITKYARSLTGEVTSILHLSIIEQREYARMHQSDIPEEYTNYLFVSSESPDKLMSDTDFNAYLKKVCEENKILDANGNIAHITSHDLRHVGVTERLHSGIISPERTRIEANHTSVSATLGYGYTSMHDENQRTSKIVQGVFQDVFTEAQAPASTVLPPKKYSALKENPFTRLLPGIGLCSDVACVPRFEICLQCEHFTPNKIYIEYFRECSALTKKRLEKLYKNPITNAAAIKFNEKQFELYNSFLEKMEVNDESA